MKEINQESQSGTCMSCKNCGMGCTCGGMHGYHGHPVLRIILALVMLGFVFSAGMKLGELKAELGIGYEHQGMMHERSGDEYQIYENATPDMMPATVTTVSAVAPKTATPATR